MAIQQCLVLIKPDGIQRGLIGEIIKRHDAIIEPARPRKVRHFHKKTIDRTLLMALGMRPTKSLDPKREKNKAIMWN